MFTISAPFPKLITNPAKVDLDSYFEHCIIAHPCCVTI